MTSLHEELIDTWDFRLRKLLYILNEEKALLGNLYRIVSEERDAIVGLKYKELEGILRKKEETIMKLSLWEKEREKLGLNKKSLYEIIIECEHNEEFYQLRELYNSMKALLDAIGEIQKINEQLINRSIFHIGMSLKFLESFGISPKQSFSKEA